MPSPNRKKSVASDKEKLTTFFANNPYSQIETIDAKTIGEICVVSKPWNDESLIPAHKILVNVLPTKALVIWRCTDVSER